MKDLVKTPAVLRAENDRPAHFAADPVLLSGLEQDRLAHREYDPGDITSLLVYWPRVAVTFFMVTPRGMTTIAQSRPLVAFLRCAMAAALGQRGTCRNLKAVRLIGPDVL